MTEFSEIQKLVFEEYQRNGYLERWNKASEILLQSDRPELARIIHLGEVGLFTTEVSEILEEIRGTQADSDHLSLSHLEDLAEELADLIIRVLNYASRIGVDLEPFILKKHRKNMEREVLHGRKI